ncbi:hypothetical protein BN961_02678 [Afipia felis]|uniref:Uncharacterized protein n=1 Tax=Afipia felis TaxID=1035 RepID=A0A090MU80_AFIFE|nr:hypothetical protein BN961_02678 [Afipia felis]
MIDIEQRALRTLEQDALALAALVVEQIPDRIRIRQHLRRDFREFFQDQTRIDLRKRKTPSQRIVVRQQPLDLVRQGLRIGEIHQADRAAADLVFIGGADAALGGTDRGRLAGVLAHRIELAMQR